jgi:hypothetical protein
LTQSRTQDILVGVISSQNSDVEMTRLLSILPFISVSLLLFFVGTANASFAVNNEGGSAHPIGTKFFVIAPKQELVVKINPNQGAQVSGNVSVLSGVIDCSINTPNAVHRWVRVSTANFTFIEDENGSYSICMSNSYEAFSVLVELNYRTLITINCSLELQMGMSSSVQTRRTFATPPLSHQENENGSIDLFALYLNFQEAGQILRTINSGSAFLPLRGLNFINCVALLTALIGIVTVELFGRRHRLALNVANVISMTGTSRTDVKQ